MMLTPSTAGSATYNLTCTNANGLRRGVADADG